MAQITFGNTTQTTSISTTAIDYSILTDAELVQELFNLLTKEQRQEIQNMSIGLKPALDALAELKSALVSKFSNVREDLIEEKLANALALAKREYGSSLRFVDGNLGLIKFLKSDEKLDSDNFKFLASLSQEPKPLEVMFLESGLRKLLEISENILRDVPSEFIIELKRRINGIKPLEDDALDGIF